MVFLNKKTELPKLNKKQKELLIFVQAKEEHRLLLMSKKNVIGMGVGYRTRGDKITNELAIKIYVSQKIPKNQLKKTDLIPSLLDFKDKKIGVDVEASKMPVAQVFTLRSRPLVGGSSIGTVTASASMVARQEGMGTLGVCVTLDDGETYMLSNNHVMSRCNQLPIGTDIIQPSIADGGVAANDIIASLSHAPAIDFGTTTVTIPFPPYSITIPNRNYVDCALAQVHEPFVSSLVTQGSSFNNSNREIHWIGYPAFKIEEINLMEQIMLFFHPVHKMGRTTEYTVGTIVDVAFDGFSDFSLIFNNPEGTNVAWFENQLKIVGKNGRAFSDVGDSGSLVLDAESNKPIGLLFAGDENGSVANPIKAVMNALGIKRI